MTLNSVFNTWTPKTEQDMYENIIIEMIQIHGMELSYIPRELNNLDEIWHEDAISNFTNVYNIEAYLTSFSNYEGDGTFMSMVGIQVRDSIRLSISKKRFTEVFYGVRERPFESDIIYLPQFNKRLFKIMKVDNSHQFYQLGKAYTWDLTCEMMEYSAEEISTGDYEMDAKIEEYDLSNDSDPADYDIPYDESATNEELDALSDNLIDLTKTNPFGSY